MTLPVEINPSLLVSRGYNIARSVRLRSGASPSLVRTFGTPTSQNIWTYSVWVKRGAFGANYNFGPSVTGQNTQLFFSPDDKLNWYVGFGYVFTTTQVFRDPSAWYHIVLSFSGGAVSNKVRLYVNGSEVTSFSADNRATTTTTNINTAISHGIGVYLQTPSNYFDGYLAEINFVDGQQLTPSSFGAFDGNGIWQPKAYAGTYGTNGFYLKFLDNSAATAAALGKDSSGNGNNWTPTNISVTAGVTYDSMLDSPTNYYDGSIHGNYATWNPLDYDAGSGTPQTGRVLTDGNLNLAYAATTWAGYRSTIAATSGKWYVEMTCTAGGGGYNTTLDALPTTQAKSLVSAISVLPTAGSDVLAIALNLDAGTWTTYRNNTQVATGSTTAGAEYCFRVTAGNGVNTFTNFGQRPFTYTPPTGFVGLSTYSLSTPTILNGAQYMAASTYTGTGATQSIVNSGNNAAAVSFKPDLVWIKGRNVISNNVLIDSVRGAAVLLSSDQTVAESSATTFFSSINSNGFTVTGTSAATNQSAESLIGWQWQAGQGTTTVNTSGTTTSNVSVNQSAGFSIVTCAASPSQTVGHGLGVAPRMIIVKSRTSASLDWYVYHASNGNTGYTLLNTTGAFVTNATVWNNTSPTSSVFTLGSGFVNASWGNIVAYCWSEVAGYSKFGSYTGNGAADGPFIYCGFRPRFVLIKDTTSAVTNWQILDTSRDTYNQVVNSLTPTASSAESVYGSSYGIDVTANGFKIRLAGSPINISTDTHIFAAFAENPFKISRAR